MDLKWSVSQRFSSYVLCFHTSPASLRGLGKVLFKGVGPEDRHGPGRGGWLLLAAGLQTSFFLSLSLAQPLSLYSSSPEFPTIWWGSSPTMAVPLSIPNSSHCLLRPPTQVQDEWEVFPSSPTLLLRSTHTHTHTHTRTQTLPSPFSGEVLNRQHNQQAASRLRH